MTLINALEILEAKGITRLTGLSGASDISTYMDHAVESHELALQYADTSSCWKYTLDHEDDHDLVALPDGNYIIVTLYGDFDMPIWSTYASDDEMYAAYDEYKVSRQAEEIADEMMVSRPNVLPRTGWIAIATAEIRKAYASLDEEFNRLYPAG